MRDSIFFASIRSLFVSLFAVVGIGIGLFAVILLISLMSESSEGELDTVYKKEILPNAEGVRKTQAKEAPVILQVNIHGLIGTDSFNTKTIRQQLIESREGAFEHNRIKALFLHVNSPGGTIDDSDGIYRLIKEYKEKYKTPVYAYVDGMCASGGMYIACAADKIYASDVSLVGSVGVLVPTFLNFTQLLDKVGVQTMTLTAGKGKDEMNPLRPWKPGEEDSYQSIIDYYYKRFVEIVTTNRPKLDKTKLVDDYGAHIFPAAIAQQYGYIDQSGMSLGDAQKALLKELGIEGDYYQIIQLESKNWLSGLYKGEFSFLTGKVIHEIRLTPELDAAMMNKFLYMYSPNN